MGQNQQDFVAAVKRILCGHGFEDVDMQSAPLPQYMTDAFNDQRDAARFEYYRITTKQGNFGIIGLPGDQNQLLDFTGTGIPAEEFYPDDVLAKLPLDWPCLISIEDSEQLLLLWQLLTKKKAQP